MTVSSPGGESLAIDSDPAVTEFLNNSLTIRDVSHTYEATANTFVLAVAWENSSGAITSVAIRTISFIGAATANPTPVNRATSSADIISVALTSVDTGASCCTPRRATILHWQDDHRRDHIKSDFYLNPGALSRSSTRPRQRSRRAKLLDWAGMHLRNTRLVRWWLIQASSGRRLTSPLRRRQIPCDEHPIKRLSWLWLAVAACFSLPASAGTFYVSPNGGGTTCSQGSPCSIQRAFSNAVAGDIWNFNAGTYNLGSALSVANSGSNCGSGMITFQATPGSERQAVIIGQGIGATGKSYIRFKNLKLSGIANAITIIGWGGGSISSTCIRIEGNEIVNAHDSAIYPKGHFNSPAWQGDARTIRLTDVIVEDNLIYGGGAGGNEMISVAYGVDNVHIRNNTLGDYDQIGIDFKNGVSNGTMHDNTFFGDVNSQLYIDAGWYVEDIEIYNNLVLGGGSVSAGIVLNREDWAGDGGILRRFRVYNNIIHGATREGIRISQHPRDPDCNDHVGKNCSNPKAQCPYKNGTTTACTCSDVDIYNNTIVGVGSEGRAGINVTNSNCSDIVVRNNIIWDHKSSTAYTGPFATQSNNIFNTTNPQFVDQGADNFRLQSGSPAIDAGTPSGAPAGAATDLDGNTRPAGNTWDIGAFEFGGTGSGGETGRPCELLTSADPVPSGVGAAYNVFSGTEETLITVNCGATANADVDIGNGASTTLIYKFAYEWDGSSWDQVALSGGQADGNWFVGSAQATLTRNSGELTATNYIAAYICLRARNAWKCGCRDATCASNLWNLQTFAQQ